MSEKPIRSDFTAKTAERQLEVFLLSNDDRKKFRTMEKEQAAAEAALSVQQRAREDADIRAAMLAIRAERPKPEHVPKWAPPRKPLKEAELQARATERVAEQNRAELAQLIAPHGERQEAFLAEKKEERLVRELRDRDTVKERPPPSLQKDFDRAR